MGDRMGRGFRRCGAHSPQERSIMLGEAVRGLNAAGRPKIQTHIQTHTHKVTQQEKNKYKSYYLKHEPEQRKRAQGSVCMRFWRPVCSVCK